MGTRVISQDGQGYIVTTDVQTLDALVPTLRNHAAAGRVPLTVRIGKRHIGSSEIKSALAVHGDAAGVLRALGVKTLA
jgi:hypothetical protein